MLRHASWSALDRRSVRSFTLPETGCVLLLRVGGRVLLLLLDEDARGCLYRLQRGLGVMVLVRCLIAGSRHALVRIAGWRSRSEVGIHRAQYRRTY